MTMQQPWNRPPTVGEAALVVGTAPPAGLALAATSLPGWLVMVAAVVVEVAVVGLIWFVRRSPADEVDE